ncbi:MAG: hypothetical protein QXT81_04090 [Candidatus Bathyarchaeia archaeon]
MNTNCLKASGGSTIDADIQPLERLKKEIAKSYDSNPLGWSIHVGRDRRNFSQILVSHGSQLWILKEEWINPYKSVGFGARLECGGESLRVPGTQEFGLRPLAPKQMKQLAELMSRNEDPRDLLLRVMRSSPIASHDIRSPLVLQGPIIASPNPLSLLSDKHQELDLRLREKLERLLLRKHPQTVIPYL